MSIRVVCGHIGQGKTLYALSLLEQAAKVGRPVLTNISLSSRCPYASRVGFIDDEEALVCGRTRSGRYEAFWHFAPPESVVVIDEADWYFDCSDHGSVAKDVRQYHKQVRKLKHDLIYIVQHVPNMYVRIRRLTTSFVVCEWNYRSNRFFQLLPKAWSRFQRSEFSSDEFTRRSHMADGYWTYSEGSRFFPWYRTDQMLGDVSFYSESVRAYIKGAPKDGVGKSVDRANGGGVGELSGGGPPVGAGAPAADVVALGGSGGPGVVGGGLPVPGQTPAAGGGGDQGPGLPGADGSIFYDPTRPGAAFGEASGG
jgi:hypothetical protein